METGFGRSFRKTQHLGYFFVRKAFYIPQDHYFLVIRIEVVNCVLHDLLNLFAGEKRFRISG